MTGTGSSCEACKFLRRRCSRECVFAPHFSYEQAATHFAAVHKVFGASNASKLLRRLPLENRSEAALTISFEALARIHDPVYGCVAHIFALQNQVACLKEEIVMIRSQMAVAFHQPDRGSNNQAFYNMSMKQLGTLSNGMNLDKVIDQETSFLQQTGNFELTDQLPQVSGRHEAISQICCDSDTLQAQFGEMGQCLYPQNPWMHIEVGFN